MKNRTIAIVAILTASSIGSLGLKAFATDSHQVLAVSGSIGETSDLALNDRVETILRTDIGLAGSKFRVLTRSGVVTLAGMVPDEHALRRALDLASGVRGVREVRNSMEIEYPK